MKKISTLPKINIAIIGFGFRARGIAQNLISNGSFNLKNA